MEGRAVWWAIQVPTVDCNEEFHQFDQSANEKIHVNWSKTHQIPYSFDFCSGFRHAAVAAWAAFDLSSLKHRSGAAFQSMPGAPCIGCLGRSHNLGDHDRDKPPMFDELNDPLV